jgi:hypothetical protein
MSERLIVEFYEEGKRDKPVATVLAYHGGQDPEAAAFTLAAFFSALKTLEQPRFNDAQVLAARFVSWQGFECRLSAKPFDFIDVGIINDSKEYEGYLIARVHAHSVRPHVEFVKDSFCAANELSTASIILGQSYVDRMETP